MESKTGPQGKQVIRLFVPMCEWHFGIAIAHEVFAILCICIFICILPNCLLVLSFTGKGLKLDLRRLCLLVHVCLNKTEK